MNPSTELLPASATAAEPVGLGSLIQTSLLKMNTLDDEQRTQLSQNLRITFAELLRRGQSSLKDFAAKYLQLSSFKEMAKQLLLDIDDELALETNAILHDKEFKQLEASWRGLRYLIDQTDEADPRIEVRVLDTTKAKLIEDLGSGEGIKDSQLYRMVFSNTLDVQGADPFGVLIGDFEFGYQSQDVDLLDKLGEMGKYIGLPFVSAAAPSLLGLTEFTQLAKYKEGQLVKHLGASSNYTRWNSFREQDHARYVALVMPHFMLRYPYCPEDNPIKGLPFREDMAGEHGNYLWGNAAYALAARMTRSFSENGWHTALCGWAYGDGKVKLPTFLYENETGQKVIKVPTEVFIPDTRFGELRKLGIIALSMRDKSDSAVFLDVPTCRSVPLSGRSVTPQEENLQLASDLRNVLTLSRVSHYLIAICRDYIGSGESPDAIRSCLSNWLMDYVVDNQDAKTTIKNGRPLKQAIVKVLDTPGESGHYYAKVELVPHIHFKRMTADLSIVARLEGSIPVR